MVLDLPPLLDSVDVARWLGIPARRVERLARDGVLPSVEVLGERRFEPSALRDWYQFSTRPLARGDLDVRK